MTFLGSLQYFFTLFYIAPPVKVGPRLIIKTGSCPNGDSAYLFGRRYFAALKLCFHSAQDIDNSLLQDPLPRQGSAQLAGHRIGWARSSRWVFNQLFLRLRPWQLFIKIKCSPARTR